MSTGKLRDLTEGEIVGMLSLLDPADRDTWVRMAMAVKSELGEGGFDVWDHWSRGDTHGYEKSAAASVWKSAKIGPVTVGSLVHAAKECGYVIDNEDVPQLSQEEIEAREKTRKEAKKKADAADRAEKKRAREQAGNIWDNAAPCDVHPYLVKKRVQSYGLRVGNWPVISEKGSSFIKSNVLLIPIMSADGVIHSLQAIYPEKPANPAHSDRYYLKGGLKSGCFFIIGEIGSSEIVAFCEGYATGATIHALTGWTVVICFDRTNISRVAEEMRELCRGKQVLIVGDNDMFTPGNPGKTDAKKAANTLNCLWMVPQFNEVTLEQNTVANPVNGKLSGPTDINDLFNLESPEIARAQLLEVIAPKTPAPVTAAGQDKLKSSLSDEEVRPFFKPLGYSRNKYYYLSTSTAQIIELTPTAHSKGNMLQLAPLAYWEMEYGGRTGINWDKAMDEMMGDCHDIGIFSMEVVRGRGAWMDKGRTVYHFGDRLIVDGVEMETWEIDSKHVYERLLSLKVPDVKPLTDEEGARLMAISEMFQWKRPESALLLMGFIALAPICGALPWRPHVWITGGPGSGKSTVFEKFTNPMLSAVSIYAQGASSEAGIRQVLKGDALPVLFDESEQNNDRETQRIQNVIAMARQTSSDSQAKTYKGSANGESVTYLIRSMFCFASIQVGLKHQADVERLSVLTLKSKEERTHDSEQWDKLAANLHEIETDPTLSGRLIRRVLKLQAVTMRNLTVFKRAASKRFGTVRDGDQYGTLIAGAYSLLSEQEVTEADALAFINLYAWENLREVESIDESEIVLQTILNIQVRLPSGLSGTVYRVWMQARGVKQDGLGLTPSEAKQLLESLTMNGNGQQLAIGNSETVERAFSKTPFANDWKGLAARIPDVVRGKAVKINGRTAKCLVIPFSLVDENAQLTF